MNANHDIHVTVAAIIESGGRFLLVEERVDGKVVLNQPAGHLDPGESLADAVARETFEETGYTFVPSHLVGIYHWQNETGTTFVRFAFCGKHTAPTGPVRLDVGIVGAHWLSRAQILAREHDLRSSMVLRGIDDYLAGARHSLDLVPYLSRERLARSAQ
ncbi:MAG TPA: NUDIX hydrolase [Gammaproteobacteria bacterium]|nr:NUDIX hydrolase [Gammaproteobacteria bacterium]